MDDLELIGMDYLWRVRSFKNNDNILAVIYLRSRHVYFLYNLQSNKFDKINDNVFL